MNCANCGLPEDEHKTMKEYLWGGDFMPVLVCPTATYEPVSGPWNTPDLDDLLPGDPEPRLAGEEVEDG